MVLDAIDAFRLLQIRGKRQDIHLALVVPDARLFNLLKAKALIIQPPYQNVHVELHILVDDKRDPYRNIEWQTRVALVESGLVHPIDAHITYPDQVTLGWPTPETE